MKIHINKFGQITDEKSDYEAELQGSFYRYGSGYMYEIKNIVPYIPLKCVFSEVEIDLNLKNNDMKLFIIAFFVGLCFGLCSVLILRTFIDSEFLIGWISALIASRAIDYFTKFNALKH